MITFRQYYARPAGWLAFLAGLAVLMAILCSQVLWDAISPDYSIWIRQARDMAAGKTLYVDSYDIKQPTLVLFVRLLDWGHPKAGLYVGHVVLGSLAGLLLYWALVVTRARRPWVVPPLVLCWTTCTPLWSHGSVSEAFSVYFDVMAASFLFLAAKRGSLACAIAGGASYFMVPALRVPCAVHGLAYVPILWLCWRERGLATSLRLLAGFCAGVAVMAGLACWHAVAHGYWAAWWEVYNLNKGYASLSAAPLAKSAKWFMQSLGQIGSANSAAFFLAFAGAFWLLADWRRLSRDLRAWTACAFAWFFAGCLSALPGARNFPHYFEVLWPPLLILGGLWLSLFHGGRRVRLLGRRLALTILAFTILLSLAERAFVYSLYRSRMAAGSLSGPVIERMQKEIDANVGPAEPMLCIVWEDWAQLLWLARRPSVGRLPTLAPFLRVEAHRPVIEADLRRLLANPPRWALLDDEFYSNPKWYSAPDVQALKNLVQAQYVVFRQVGPLRLLRRDAQR